MSVISLARVSKDYRGLRPLRLERLDVDAGERVAITGFDHPSAEVFVNLVTGAALPDAGTVTVFGRETSGIADSGDWLSLVDRFGIVSHRAVLLDAFTVIQNLAMPFSLDIDPPSDEVGGQAAALALETGIPDSTWMRPVSGLDARLRARVHLARALALNPPVLLLEHASAGLDLADAVALGDDIRDIARERHAAVVALTADDAFARSAADRVYAWDPASGRLNLKRVFL